MRKQITWEEFCDMRNTGNIPEGKRLIYMADQTYWIDDQTCNPIIKSKSTKGKKKGSASKGSKTN